ncbi:MAG: hypothetical protein LBH29_07610 [Elusimicrobiota bacterium]|jgi:hypothetical protein|nr:hypothetical protein [Elusimicrobiota bacterium]
MKNKKKQIQNGATEIKLDAETISAESVYDKKMQIQDNGVVSVKPWQPSFKQLGILSGAILIFLIIVFFLGNLFLKPYMIEPPKAITPWLDTKKETPPFVPAFESNNSIK